ncbi:esterase/lipase family protein [Gordonia sp. CPCC 205333]|uniref:esterase/lipase family protein n=1 Tax=Gordonia sp. CPCC 205333 TaxID=3140790 RepID=UPI003AF40216
MRILRVVAAILFGGAIAVSAAPAHATPAKLPVTYNFLAGIDAELRDPGGSLPGSNDYSCRPSAAHPRPVILVHGSGGGRQTNWGTLVPVLRNEGYCVFVPTYGELSNVWPASAIGGMGPKLASAWQVKYFVDDVLARTGSDQVDIVGHSLGTEIPTYWIKYLGGKGKVRHYVSLAPYWQQGPDEDDARSDFVASIQQRLGISQPPTSCMGCAEPATNLNFNRAVREPTPYVLGIAYTNISTRDDEVVTPYSVGQLAGPPGIDVNNIVVQQGCPLDRSDHASITSNRRSAALVLNALDPAHPRATPCIAVAPFTGG